MNTETICIWPDGDWCYWGELGDFHWKSDDFFLAESLSAEHSEQLALEHSGV